MAIKSNKKRLGRQYYAKLTSKYQATVPKEIRNHLHLESGDEIMYELLSDDTVILRRKLPFDMEYHIALDSIMNEWGSEEDERAYKDL